MRTSFTLFLVVAALHGAAATRIQFQPAPGSERAVVRICDDAHCDQQRRTVPVTNGLATIGEVDSAAFVNLVADGFWAPPVVLAPKTSQELNVPVWRTAVIRGSFI